MVIGREVKIIPVKLMVTAETPPARESRAILYDFVRDSHIFVAFIAMMVVMLTSAAYYGKMDANLVFFGFATPYIFYTLSDWMDLLLRPGVLGNFPRDRKTYRFVSIPLAVVFDVILLVNMAARGTPFWEILIFHLVGGFVAWYRASFYMPRLRDPEISLYSFLSMEVVDTVVFTCFISYSAVWHYQKLVTAEPFFFSLALIPVQFSMGITWKIDSVPNKLNWLLKSSDFGAILQWWTLVSGLVILNSVLLGVYGYGFLLLALLPLFNYLLLRVIWLDWRDYFQRFIIYVSYQILLCGILAYLFVRFPLN